jgi:hypothetical protein
VSIKIKIFVIFLIKKVIPALESMCVWSIFYNCKRTIFLQQSSGHDHLRNAGRDQHIPSDHKARPQAGGAKVPSGTNCIKSRGKKSSNLT